MEIIHTTPTVSAKPKLTLKKTTASTTADKGSKEAKAATSEALIYFVLSK